MGYYSGFKYGTGILYGIQSEIVAVEPTRGPSPGGNRFVITGEGFDPRMWDDNFQSSLLSSSWVDISAEGGSVYTGVDHLRLSTGAASGAVAGVKTDFGWNDTQGEIRLIIASPRVYPSEGEVVVCRYSLWVGDSTYAQMYVTLNSDERYTLRCETWVGGFKADEMRSSLSWTEGTSIFKILRWGSDVYFIANGLVVWSTVKFVTDIAYFRISSENLVRNYDVNSLKVEWFYFRPFVVFQDQPVHDTVVVSNRRVRGLVPPSMDIRKKAAAFKGFVDVSVVGMSKAISEGAYEYYFVRGLKAINEPQFSMGLDIINDSQLETPEGTRKGLGDGY